MMIWLIGYDRPLTILGQPSLLELQMRRPLRPSSLAIACVAFTPHVVESSHFITKINCECPRSRSRHGTNTSARLIQMHIFEITTISPLIYFHGRYRIAVTLTSPPPAASDYFSAVKYRHERDIGLKRCVA